MIRFQVGDHQIIYLASCQSIHEILFPCLGTSGIHCIHKRDLLIQNQIGIVGNALRHNILTFKQIDGGIIHTDVSNSI